MLSQKKMTAEKPPVQITAAEFGRLAPLARAESTPGARLLAEELDRATLLYGRPRPGVAHLGSVVTYLDRTRGRIRTIQLVAPEEAGTDDADVSVLSPLGAALLGLAEGHTFRRRMAAGEAVDLKILAVGWRDQPLPEGGVRYFRRAPAFSTKR
jgi:regulator of nucleoside diphosphate kinase